MDSVGVFTVAFVTAFGGGTLRDLLLDRRPFFWVQHVEYVILILVLTLIAAPIMKFAQRVIAPTAFVVADAIGLGFFSIAGVSVAAAFDLPWIVAAMMGVITGVAGGILRDVILNEVPMVLRDGKPYALAAFVGCWFYLLMIYFGSPEPLALWTSGTLIVAIRLIAWRANWTIK
ncbi:trimeric intracellular cation channel family protein [Betaproteobacteria bacterium PRO7]|nr:trimeric intracellular cation channel family protein [Betaproteobacteria bacterium PRO7]